MRILNWALTSAALGAALIGALTPRTADACGCFAPPFVDVPIVQAGERILFAQKDGVVTAYIQIQYAGAAREFGWILPLPAEPDMKLATEELFDNLIATTQPSYRLNYQFEACGGDDFNGAPGRGGSTGAGGGAAAPEADGGGAESPVVKQASIGPYDFAVLRGDRRDEMFQWLVDNGYFIPAGTQDVVGPYIHEGAFFLALKLRSGNDAGDLQPVVVTYKSDLPMIPIVLTSVAANPNMGIQVWMAGEGRAIPRNYFHAVLNEALIDWFNNAQNYNDVIIRATNEAESGHAFVTEFAGPSSVMQNRLSSEGRYGSEAQLARQMSPGDFVQYTYNNGFRIDAALLGVLRKHIPMPPGLAAAPYFITEQDYWQNTEYYLGSFRTMHPELFEGFEFSFDPAAAAHDVFERIVYPNRAAQAVIDAHPKLSRLYTTLSPDEMTADPVFSWNAELPDVSNIHYATYMQYCMQREDLSGELVLEDGRRIGVKNGNVPVIVPVVPGSAGASGGTGADGELVPASQRIERLREEGTPEVAVDNTMPILAAINDANAGTVIPSQVQTMGDDGMPTVVEEEVSSGCASTGSGAGGAGLLVVLGALALGLAAASDRRRARRSAGR